MADISRLALAVHFHQPVGNLDTVVRKATDRCYRPFLEVLGRHEDILATLHYSGCLLEWLETNAPDVTEMLSDLVSLGRVELMTGGFYEPILAALPERDRVGQVRLLTHHLERVYGAVPTGAWLTERVWEQDVVGSLVEAGVRWTVIDDTIFHAAGVVDADLTGPFVTDHNGAPLLVYPGDRSLRYLIPYKRVDRVIDHIKSQPQKLWVYADDGEKFGEWPDTYERVYEGGWLDEFFFALEDEEGIETVFLGRDEPRGRVYPPSASYDEMMTWALPTDARITLDKLRRGLQAEDPKGALPFTRGTSWRAFLAKYPEVNHLHKRMLLVSDRLHDAGAGDDALRSLYKSQCNCAYWHGVFGGVYLTFMRTALWHHLMRAESSAKHRQGAEHIDIDADTRTEVAIHTPWGVVVAAPHAGGRLIEIDDHRVGANLLAGMGRHREAYHVVDEGGEEEPAPGSDEMAASGARSGPRLDLVPDPFGVGALIDLIDGERVEGAYEYGAQGDRLTMLYEERDLQITKTITGAEDGFTVTYELLSGAGRSLEFGIESFVTPLDLGRDLGRDRVRSDRTTWSVTRPEGEAGLEVTSDLPPAVFWETVAAVSATLEGLKPMEQGTRVVASWPVELLPGDPFTLTQRWRVVINEAAGNKPERGVSA